MGTRGEGGLPKNRRALLLLSRAKTALACQPYIPAIYRGTHIGSTKSREQAVWGQIDLVNRINSYLASHDLHSSLKSVSNLVPLLTANLLECPSL